MKRKVITVLSVLVVIAIGATVYYLRSEKVLDSSNSIMISQYTDSDGVAWITYNDKAHGIAFTYPSEWGNPGAYATGPQPGNPYEIQFQKPFFEIDYGINKNYDQSGFLNFDEFVEQQRRSLSKDPSFKESQTKIGDSNAVKFTLIARKGTGGGGDYNDLPLTEDQRYVQILAGGAKNNVLTISYEYPLRLASAKEGEFEKVISSVVFPK